VRIGSLFSGYGGLDMAVTAVLGGSVAWHADVCKVNGDGSVGHKTPHGSPCAILEHHWPDVPNLGDVSAVDWSQVEPVDVLTGGFPCQDVSHAGKRAGLRPDTRSGLWSQMAYAVDQLRPALVVIENVRGLLSAPAHSDVEPCPICLGDGPDGALRALGAVLGDLAELGYDARWCGVRAADAGAPHGRFRVFVVAHAAHVGHERFGDAWGWRDGPADDAEPAADASRDGRDEGWTEPARVVVGPDAAERGEAAADADRDGQQAVRRVDTQRRDPDRRDRADTAWGDYEPAIRRWEHILGRPAPAPTGIGDKGQPKLSARFVEWMQGLPDGWVADVPGVSWNDALKALGNGVVPQQAELALRWLLFGEWAGVPAPEMLLRSPSAQEPGFADAGRLVNKDGELVSHLNQRVYDPDTGRLVQTGLTQQVQLLPTPAVNDMGAGKTPDDWDAWTDRMKAEHGNGNGHGKSLHIEAQRIGGAA
jgi:DNA (cytosine-5)-methyltransferase 1